MDAGKRFGGICLAAALALTASPAIVARAQTPVQGVELSARAASIVGTVLDSNERAVPAAQVRLRDVTSGRLVMTTRGDQNGVFRFGGIPRGSYVIEFVDDEGKVRGVSQTLVVAPGETLSTVVRLGAHRTWYSGFFKNAAVAAVSSAAVLGVTAVGTGSQPASSRF
jgi:hypothetical protein